MSRRDQHQLALEAGERSAPAGANCEADGALARARAREVAREAARQPIDYKRMQRELPTQKARLTRALKAEDRRKVVSACVEAIHAWDEIGAWPDDWARWQRALDQVFPVFEAPRLEDLR